MGRSSSSDRLIGESRHPSQFLLLLISLTLLKLGVLGFEIYQVPSPQTTEAPIIQVEWQTESGVVYQLESSTNDSTSRWQPIGRPVLGTGARFTQALAGQSDVRFFRLREDSPPYERDSDDDLVPDGWELQYGSDPNRFDSNLDPDQNGLSFLAEYQTNQRPLAPPSTERSAESVHLNWKAGAAGELFNIYRRVHRFSSEESLNIDIKDNSFQDWEEVKEATSFPYPPEDSIHMQRIWVANDRENLYIRIKHAIGLGAIFEPSVFIDLDRDFKTGSGSKNWLGMPIGAELWYDHRAEPGDGGSIHLTTKRRVWDPNWEGPFSSDLFRRGNFADPFNAWNQDAELPFTDWDRRSDGHAHGQALENNSWEIKIPFSDLSSLTGMPVDSRKFGADLFFAAHFFDQFPTVGYAPKSPVKFEYGFKQLNPEPFSTPEYVDHPIGDLAYDYRIFKVGPDGEETLVASFDNRHVPRAHPSDFNVSIINAQTLRGYFKFPEDEAIERVRIVRRPDRFASHANDGDEVLEISSLPGEPTYFLDQELQTGQPYFYSAFGIDRHGRSSREFWDTKDRSIPSQIKGPIPGLTPQDDYLVYFASWDHRRIQFAKKYDLVILHPGGGAPLISPEEVAELKAGLDGIPNTEDDVVVIGYVSIGEDFGINRSQIEQNTLLGIHPNIHDYPPGGPWENPAYNWPRKIETNTTGPVRYSFTEDSVIATNAEDPVYQFPSFYTDMIDYHGQGGAGHDGFPDQNSEWGGLYINVADPTWQDFIRKATIERDFVAGIDHVLGDQPGQLNCDGIFLDTVGISTPWSIWFPATVYGDLYWIRDGTLDFMARISSWFPNKVILPNRPMHLVFPEFAGKRYDDFRSIVSSIYWESFTPDLLFWWVDEHAPLFEETVKHAQSNHDGKGFTTLVLDYWAVMFDATEGGEFQQAPWYEEIKSQIDHAEGNGFLTHITGSRSLAELTDYVYHYHNQDIVELPDLYVHSIHGRELENGQIEATVQIINQGAAVSSAFTVATSINDQPLASEQIEALAPFQRYSFTRQFERQAIGNYFWVEVDATQQIDELDEAPDFVEPNNRKGKLLDRYLEPDEHWYPEGFAPDIHVSKIHTTPEFPVPGEPSVVNIHYTNLGDGVAPDSRHFIWGGRGTDGRQIGNERSPFLLPGETKVLQFPFVPDQPGVYSIGVNSDATAQIIESDELNNTSSARFIVLNSDPTQLPFDWDQPNVLGPYSDTIGDGISAAADLVSANLAASDEELSFRMQLGGGADFNRFQYVQFLDLDNQASTGYQVAGIGAEALVLNGSLSRYSGSGPDWKWTPSREQARIQLSDDQQAIEIHLHRDQLELDPQQAFQAFYLISDGNNATPDDSLGPFASPPYHDGPFRLDGRFGDWENNLDRTQRLGSSDDESQDGIGADGEPALAPLHPSADFIAASAALTENTLWLTARFEGAIDFQASGYTVFIDADTNAQTGFSTGWGTVGAEYRIWNGLLYRYTGDDTAWETQWDLLATIFMSSGTQNPERLELAIPTALLDLKDKAPMGFLFMTTDNQALGEQDGLLENGLAAWTDDITDFFPEPGNGSAIFPIQNAPDLVVTNIDISPKDRELKIGTPATIRVTVANVGQGSAASTNLETWIGGHPLQNIPIPSLESGESWTGELIWQSPFSGSFWLGVSADTSHQVGELEESNNSFGINVNVWDP